MYCQTCGAVVDKNDKYCHACGAKQPVTNVNKSADHATFHESPKNESTPTIIIVAFVMSFIIPLAGLIMSLVIKSDSDEEKKDSNQLLTAALIISIVRIVLSGVSFLWWLF